MFIVTVESRFRARHALTMGDGSREAPHEHEWRCAIELTAEELDAAGCAIDFRAVDAALTEVLDPLRDTDLHANALFASVGSSTENVARYLFRALGERLNAPGRRVARATVWEDAQHSAAYSEA